MAFFHSAFYDLPTSVRKIPALQAAGPMTQRDFRNDLMSQAWPVDLSCTGDDDEEIAEQSLSPTAQ